LSALVLETSETDANHIFTYIAGNEQSTPSAHPPLSSSCIRIATAFSKPGTSTPRSTTMSPRSRCSNYPSSSATSMPICTAIGTPVARRASAGTSTSHKTYGKRFSKPRRHHPPSRHLTSTPRTKRQKRKGSGLQPRAARNLLSVKSRLSRDPSPIMKVAAMGYKHRVTRLGKWTDIRVPLAYHIWKIDDILPGRREMLLR
jgi:hypothetical protein